MKVFLSSVRRGLEMERDALTGLIRAIGHEPLRFEDFTAQSHPSREACLRAVDQSDVYLMLLGPHYGHVFPETGQSATHDEYVAAVTKGIPRLVFRKTGVEFEDRQEELAREVGEYGTGVFYETFESAVDLQAKVVNVLRAVAEAPSALAFTPLRTPVSILWRDEWRDSADRATAPALEVHVVPVTGERRPARLMAELPEQIVTALRTSGVIPLAAGVAPTASPDAVEVVVPDPSHRGFRDVREGAIRGVRAHASGQISVWWTLPGDSLGAILDEDDLKATVARSLRLFATLRLLTGDQFAIGLGMNSTSMVSEGRLTGVARSSASFGFGTSRSVRVDPDESVTAAAFDRGAEEVAAALTRAFLVQFRRLR